MKLKKFVAVCMAIAMMSVPLSTGVVSVSAVETASVSDSENYDETSGQCGENVFWSLDDNGTVTITGVGEMYNYDFDTNGVALSPWCGYSKYKDTITSIKIADGVTSIGRNSFYNCRKLKNIEIPDSVTYIGYDAFYNTAWYDNQSNGLLYAGKVVYKYKGTIPKNTSIALKDGTKGIAEKAFFGRTNLIGIEIPDSVTYIGDDAFVYCTNLASIKIPDSVTRIGDNVFCQCENLTSVEMSNNVTEIAFGIFDGCVSLTDIKIPNNVTKIGAYAFYSCSSLTNIEIPDSVTEISSYAFAGCKYLTDIKMSNNLTTIGFSAFYDTYWYNTQPSGIVYAGKAVYSYNGEMPEDNNVILDDGTICVANFAFRNCDNLVSIEIPDSVTAIGEYAFSDCKDLTSVTIPNSVTTIGLDAFYNSDNVTIYGYKDSYAEKYANENNIPFVCIDEVQNAVGDVDGDGIISIKDVTSIQKYLVNLEDFTDTQLTLADVNNDGVVNINDVSTIQKYLVGIIDTLN